MLSDFLDFFADGLATESRIVARFNFVYMEQGRKSPGSAAVSEATFREVLEHLRAEFSPAQVFVGGKSYGGRMASHIAAGGAAVDGLVYLGYPLHAPGRPDKLRDEHLYGIQHPMLFVEGTRDPFCPLDTLRGVMERIPRADLLVVDDGDHSLKVRKSSGRSTEQAWAGAVRGIAEWLDR